MNESKLRKIFISAVVIFIAFVGSFYFLAGEQLTSKDSAGNIAIVEANAISEEIIKGVKVEQEFTCNIDMIEEIALVFTKQYREASGKVKVEILDGSTVIYKDTLDATNIPEQHRIYLTIDEPITGYSGKKLVLRITSDCIKNNGVYMMICKDNSMNTFVNPGTIKQKGTICFSVSGRDHIPLADYYFPIMGVLALILSAVLFKTYKDYQKGKNNLITLAILAVERYYFLISQLVSRDFKSKYKRSILGVLWSFLNPLLTMTVQFLVFSTIFRADTQSYPVYLLAGVICWNFFKETTDMCLLSISGNANLINKVYIPKYIFPLARTISSSINLGISLVPLILVTLIMGVAIKPAALLIFYFLACLIVFSLGVGMFLAALMVFFRDIQFLWSVLSQILMYATPIFYTAEIIPEQYKFVVRFNPLYHFLGNIRKCLMEGISPEPMAYIYCLIFAVVSLAFGAFVFKKTQDKFTLYL
ncbi:MAG: ABC transporter permease [Erysipelotrichaceae bacterium]|nr:ABC transporter permease [Erysipelotrichaceae bacterium]